jgi:putative ABC transport system ATP-binding protein
MLSSPDSEISTPPLIALRGISRYYPGSGAALDDVSLRIDAGEFVAVTGPSGCGKSTLMHLIAGLDSPTSGEISVAGLDLHRAAEAELTRYRRHKIGVIFQFFHLLPSMSVFENVCLPLLLRGDPFRAVKPKAEAIIELVGLSDRARHGMHQLSGGQLQRTAIARALVHEPLVLLADEPTGNLDSANTAQVMALLEKISSQRKMTMIIVTHSEDVARLSSRRICLRDGKIL